MFKQVPIAAIIALVALSGAGLCHQSETSNTNNFDDVPLANLPAPQQEQQAAATAPAAGQTGNGGAKLRGDLVNLMRSVHTGAGKAFEEARPAFQVVHNDLVEGIGNLRNNPRVQAASRVVGPRIELAKSKVVPFYEHHRSKLGGLLTRTGQTIGQMNNSARPVAAPVVPVAPVAAAETQQVADSASTVVA